MSVGRASASGEGSVGQQPSVSSQSKLQDKSRMSRAQAEAVDYLSGRHIPELFSFLVGHLVAVRPDDPIAYLYDLLDKCVLFRSGLVEPPLLFAPRHIESMFNSLDPGGSGHISLSQYAVGMRTLGIQCFNPNPMACQCNPGLVNKETFEDEAKRSQVTILQEMIAIPRVCESSSESSGSARPQEPSTRCGHKNYQATASGAKAAKQQ